MCSLSLACKFPRIHYLFLLALISNESLKGQASKLSEPITDHFKAVGKTNIPASSMSEAYSNLHVSRVKNKSSCLAPMSQIKMEN